MSLIQMLLFLSTKDVTRPAGALKELPVSVLDEMALLPGLTVQPPLGVHLDVGVADNDQLEEKQPVGSRRTSREKPSDDGTTDLPVLGL